MASATKISIPPLDISAAADGAALLASSGGVGGVFVAGSRGKRKYIELPTEALKALHSILSVLAEGGEAVLLREDDEATPAEAAAILGISRPLVYQRMDDGRLPFRTVGSHRRVRLRDVLALRPEEEVSPEGR